MAKNTHHDYRNGEVRNRKQTKYNGHYNKFNNAGKKLSQSPHHYKGIRRHHRK